MAAGPVFPRIKVWVSNEVLTASDLNTEFNNLLNNTIPASIDDYSADVSTMQSTTDPGGVGTESLATTLAGEIARLRYIIKAIKGSAQWYSSGIRNFGTGAMAILTADIVDGAVTFAKLATPNKVTSLSSSGGSVSTTSFADVNNLTCALTVTTGKVRIRIVPDNNGASASAISVFRSSNSMSMDLQLLRGATVLGIYTFTMTSGGATSVNLVTHSDLYCEDNPGAGTYTYKIQGKLSTTANSGAGAVANFFLTVEEIKG